MNWQSRISKAPLAKNDLMAASLPEWFAEAIDAGVPEQELYERIAAFIVEAENEVAIIENRPAKSTAPSAELIEATCKLYREILDMARTK